MTGKQMQKIVKMGRKAAHKRMEEIRAVMRDVHAKFESMSPEEQAEGYTMQRRLHERAEYRKRMQSRF